ncbi:hypothetical protein [Staphylococcus auricularis]|uniref:hypothetical protein n=1 Tax=Staphylococcus auricularis TaxID=29379 RepID=UPI002DBE3AF5|nr:hypothetical protein [Staphylococcus auricularis]MEB6569296.1 hypothetical protein [Staphylococcus auricularis]
MNIGLIIFIIAIVGSLISTFTNNDHKKRDPSKPKEQPRAESSKPKKSFMERVEETFKELEDWVDEDDDDEDEKTTTRQEPTPSQTRQFEPKRLQAEKVRRIEEAAQPSTSEPPQDAERQQQSQEAKDQALRDELKNTISADISNVRTEYDRAREKQVQQLQKRAEHIINDKYLSERAKRMRLKNLFASQAQKPITADNELRFSDDEVINGVIWSEVLDKPKQLS